jgi:UDP-glucose 4-epimerase
MQTTPLKNTQQVREEVCGGKKKGLRILCTGHLGFIGSHLVDELVKEHEVFGIDNLSGGNLDNGNEKCVDFIQDLRDKEKIEDICKEVKADVLYHLAADATEGRSQFTPTSAIENNLNAYMNVLIPFLKNGGKKVILFSSMSVYGKGEPPFAEYIERKPVDVYGQAKRAMEEITEILSEVHGFEYCILRPHNIYGERQRLDDPYRNVIGIFINRLLQDKPLYIYGDGEQRRAFSYIGDIVSPMVKAMELNGEIVNIGSAHHYSINQLASLISDKREYIADRPKEVKEAYCTTEKSKRLLGFEDRVSLADGITRTIIWARDRGHKEPKYLEELEIDLLNKAPRTWVDKLI